MSNASVALQRGRLFLAPPISSAAMPSEAEENHGSEYSRATRATQEHVPVINGNDWYEVKPDRGVLEGDHQVSRASSGSRWIVDLLNAIMVGFDGRVSVPAASPRSIYLTRSVVSCAIHMPVTKTLGWDVINSSHPLLSIPVGNSEPSQTLVRLCNVGFDRGGVSIPYQQRTIHPPGHIWAFLQLTQPQATNHPFAQGLGIVVVIGSLKTQRSISSVLIGPIDTEERRETCLWFES